LPGPSLDQPAEADKADNPAATHGIRLRITRVGGRLYRFPSRCELRMSCMK
jgi:hypothetical protein